MPYQATSIPSPIRIEGYKHRSFRSVYGIYLTMPYQATSIPSPIWIEGCKHRSLSYNYNSAAVFNNQTEGVNVLQSFSYRQLVFCYKKRLSRITCAMGLKATPLVTILILTVVSARLIKNHAESLSQSDSRGDRGRLNKVLNPSQLWVDKDKREVIPDVAITGTARAEPDVDVAIQSHSDHGEEDYPLYPDGGDVDTSDEGNGVDTKSRSMESDDDSNTDSHSNMSKDDSDESDDGSDSNSHSSKSSDESNSGRRHRQLSKESGNDSRQKRRAYHANDDSSHSGVSGSDSNSRQRTRRQADDISSEEDDDSNSRLKRSISSEHDNSADSRYRRNAIDVSHDDDRSNSRQGRSADDDSADSRHEREIHESGDDDEDDNSDEQTQPDNAGPVEPPTVGVQP